MSTALAAHAEGQDARGPTGAYRLVHLLVGYEVIAAASIGVKLCGGGEPEMILAAREYAGPGFKQVTGLEGHNGVVSTKAAVDERGNLKDAL
jgi:hypothetical protein